MLNLIKIKHLTKLSFFIFLFINIAVLGTLFFHNLLTSANFDYTYTPEAETISKKVFLCNKKNNFCRNINLKKSNELDNCSKYRYVKSYYINNESNLDENSFNIYINNEYNENHSIKVKFNLANDSNGIPKKNDKCIKNNPIFKKINDKFPSLIKIILYLKKDKNYIDATGKSIYPFFYGETSISNIAKRYPQKYIFKPFLFITSIFMFLYWFLNQKILNKIENKKNLDKYFIFGLLSSVCLFLHVFFLGNESENNFFNVFKKLVLITFVFSELTAQYLLIKKIQYLKLKLLNLINIFILKIKICFIYFFLSTTFLITLILNLYDLPKELEYFLEWNYFILLPFYYLFSYFLWKKNNSLNNPSSS